MDTYKLAVLAEVRQMFKGNEAGAQRRRVQEVLERGFTLNTFEASRHLDVYHCPARIKELRNSGLNIVTHWVRVLTEAGVSHRIGQYLLVRGAGHAA
jgi:hypothetical protein